MDFSFSDLNLQFDGLPPINFNSVETLPGLEARAAFTVNLSTVFREDVDIVPTVGATEDRGVNTFTSVSTFNTICGYTDSNDIKL